MFEFLLLLFIIFIVVPICRIGWTIYKVRRQYRQAFNAARGQSRRREPEQRRGGWSAPRKRKAKVVGRNEGEYVEWEDVTTVEHSETSATYGPDTATESSESIRVEERITDAEWEEVK